MSRDEEGMMATLQTDLWITIGNSADAEQKVVALNIKYRVDCGDLYLDDIIIEEQVGHGAAWAHVKEPAPNWLWRLVESEQTILDECMADWREREEYARDSHADMIREERMLSKATGGDQ